MSAPYFLYTWNVPVGHEVPATITVRAETPEQGHEIVAKEVASLQSLHRSIQPQEITDAYGRDSAESFKSEIGFKLRIIAATTLGMRINEVEEIYDNELPKRIAALLALMRVTIEPSTKPQFRLDCKPTIAHYVPIGYTPLGYIPGPYRPSKKQ
jgi:hypothetical protein